MLCRDALSLMPGLCLATGIQQCIRKLGLMAGNGRDQVDQPATPPPSFPRAGPFPPHQMLRPALLSLAAGPDAPQIAQSLRRLAPQPCPSCWLTFQGAFLLSSAAPVSLDAVWMIWMTACTRSATSCGASRSSKSAMPQAVRIPRARRFCTAARRTEGEVLEIRAGLESWTLRVQAQGKSGPEQSRSPGVQESRNPMQVQAQGNLGVQESRSPGIQGRSRPSLGVQESRSLGMQDKSRPRARPGLECPTGILHSWAAQGGRSP